MHSPRVSSIGRGCAQARLRRYLQQLFRVEEVIRCQPMFQGCPADEDLPSIIYVRRQIVKVSWDVPVS